jgi:hypothetical protein
MKKRDGKPNLKSCVGTERRPVFARDKCENVLRGERAFRRGCGYEKQCDATPGGTRLPDAPYALIAFVVW